MASYDDELAALRSEIAALEAEMRRGFETLNQLITEIDEQLRERDDLLQQIRLGVD